MQVRISLDQTNSALVASAATRSQLTIETYCINSVLACAVSDVQGPLSSHPKDLSPDLLDQLNRELQLIDFCRRNRIDVSKVRGR